MLCIPVVPNAIILKCTRSILPRTHTFPWRLLYGFGIDITAFEMGTISATLRCCFRRFKAVHSPAINSSKHKKCSKYIHRYFRAEKKQLLRQCSEELPPNVISNVRPPWLCGDGTRIRPRHCQSCFSRTQ